MTLTPIDHALLAMLTIAVPVWGTLQHGYTRRRIEAGHTSARAIGYAMIIAVEWTLVAFILWLWQSQGRSMDSLGVATLAGWPAWLGVGLAIVACALIVGQGVSIARNQEKLLELRPMFEKLLALMPASRPELRLFMGVSATAGICEEVIYRGFLIAYFLAVTNVWIAIGVSAVIFGLGHVYQGPTGFIKITMVGLVFAGLYVLTGSLWAPMLLHTVIDINSGNLGHRVARLIVNDKAT